MQAGDDRTEQQKRDAEMVWRGNLQMALNMVRSMFTPNFILTVVIRDPKEGGICQRMTEEKDWSAFVDAVSNMDANITGHDMKPVGNA